MKKRLGEMLRNARERVGMKQNEAAKRAGIHNSTLAKYESGEREPDIETIHKLAGVYDVSPNSFLMLGKNDAQTTIDLLEKEAEKLGLSSSDPVFKEMLSDAFELLRLARGKNNQK